MVQSKKWVLVKHFDGFPKKSDFELKVEELPKPKDGQVVVEAVFVSVDPYMRLLDKIRTAEGEPMFGTQVSKVIESKNPKFPVGSHVVAYCGWRSHAVCDEKDLTPLVPNWPKNISMSHAVGAVGMPGLTALYGVEEVLKPKKGETLLVNAAAGAVGTAVGQIAKIMGCKVVGSAGSDAKVAYLKELGFDVAFNYKTVNSLDETLRKASPDGYDCFFENVGGHFYDVALQQMKNFGRIAVCGSLAVYNDKEPQKGPYQHKTILLKELKIEGFMHVRWTYKHAADEKRLLNWMKEGKLKAREKVTKGFENLPDAFIGLLKGENIGKAIVEV